MATRPLPIAVLISGGGTTLANLIKQVRSGRLSVDIRLVISSSPNARGLEHARAADIRTNVLQRSIFASTGEFSRAIFDQCELADVELIVMGGFLKHVLVPPQWSGRVMNIHPSLLPAFGGKGFYGARVHQAVLESGCSESGCTIHFVDDQFDEGPIIRQVKVPVQSDDTAKSLAERVFAQECIAYPDVIQSYAEGRVTLENGKVRIAPGLA